MRDKRRVAVLISGRGSNMRALVEQAQGYEVVLVGTNRPEAAGLRWAAERGLETWAQDSKAMRREEFDQKLDSVLSEHDVGTIALAGFMRILSPWFVERWRGRVLNIHPSLLPKYRGLGTHARAIEAGDTVTGCSVHVLTEELDAGEVLAQMQVPIAPNDTAASLEERVLAAEHLLYPSVLTAFCRDMSCLLDKVRAQALSLPGAEERVSHGQPTFFVAGKQFAQFRDNHHGDAQTVVCVRVSSIDEQEVLLESAPAIYSRPAYMPTWISINLVGDTLDWDHVGDRIAQSWELAAPPGMLEAGGR